jgi:2-iminobutanoate/2-iminopropanoate deaminase
MKSIIQSSEAPAAIGPYSQAIVTGQFLFCSGQIPLDPKTGELVSDDVAEQTHRVLDNLGAVLRAKNLTFDHVIKTTVFVTDLSKFAEINAVYAKYFTNNPPARSTIQVAALPKNAKVEIEAVAVIPS